MGDTAFELRYGAITLASEVTPESVGPHTAFIAMEHPVPVGCEVELWHAGAASRATVIRVVEGIKGREDPAGMWLRVIEQAPDLDTLWSPLVTTQDVVFPEGSEWQEPEQAAVPEAEVQGEATEQMDTPGGVRKGDASDEPIDDGRQTQVMQAVTIEEAMAVSEAMAAEPTTESEPGDQAAKPKGKRKKRRRRKTR